MRKLILLIVLLIICYLAYGQQETYAEIWKEGYIDGWCYEQEYCIEPIPPVAPLPRIGDTTYTKIYNRGFVTGLAAYKAQSE